MVIQNMLDPSKKIDTGILLQITRRGLETKNAKQKKT